MASRASRSSQGGKPFSANRSNTALSRTGASGQRYPEIKQRGYYSDIIGADNDVHGEDILSGPPTAHDTHWNVAKEKHTPKVTAFATSGDLSQVVKSQSYGPTTEITDISDFPVKASEPKVQLPFYTKPGECPRKIEIERKRRLYSTLSLPELLKEENIQTELLMPKEQSGEPIELNKNPEDPAPFPPFLPLHIFDNEEFDCRTPEEWINMGLEGGVRKPCPGVALLPKKDSDANLAPTDPSIVYDWFNIGVLDYDSESQQYLVQKTNRQGRVVDSTGNAIVNGGKQPDGSRITTASQYWVPRVRLMFNAEDPRVFTQRVAEAFRLRKNTEALLRYNLYIDCMPMDGVGELDQASLKRMVEWARTAPGLSKDKGLEDGIQALEKEANIDFCRSMNRIIFDKIIEQDNSTFAFVSVPAVEEKPVPFKACSTDVPEYDYDGVYDAFAFNSLLTRVESIKATGTVAIECNEVANKCLYHVPTTKPMRIEEFEQTQAQVTSQVALFLKDSWISTLRAAIRTKLRDVGKGWFNIHETNFEVYQISKLKKFMEMVKFMMQDSMRFLVQNSLYSFTQMILDACHSTMKLEEDFVWGTDVISSPYKPKRNALFLVDLQLDNTGVHYSTNINTFESSLVGLFDKGIQSTQNVPQLEKYILEDIFWSGTPLLESVGEHEPHVEELRDSIKHAIRKALIPMKAYAREYEKHLEIMNLDINQYIRDYEAQEHTALEVKQEVEMHLKEKDIIEATIPSNLTIGPFWINTDSVRQNLSKKRKNLSNAVLEYLAKHLRKQADEACEEFKAISRKLYDKCNCIEELSDMREWMKSIPEKLKEHQDLIDKAMDDYELIEDFYYNLSTDDFNLKWTAIGWPHKIEVQMEQTYNQLEEDEERFRKLQTSDQANFNDRLDTLQMVVAGMAAHSDISKGHEIANEVRRVAKQLKEAQGLAGTYNNRERLFGMPVTNYDKLGKLVKDFEPFRNLWVTTSDWMRWHESWMNDPLTSINAEELEKNVNEAYKTMHKSVKVFNDIPSVQQVAQEIKGMIEEFKPFIPLIQGLRNPGMRSRHWDQLSNELGFSVVPKANLTFSKCLEMNLNDHIQTIAKVAEVAGKEYSIEQALDKMEKEWDPVQFEIMAYKETGTYILRSSEDTSQLLDDHIVMTQSMSFSPYKKPFEERINNWENKLTTTQDVLDEWLNCQRAWLYLEPIFSSEDINRQLPVESKRYATMERMWRKIMKNAKENPQVISLCPDSRLLDNLKECNKLLEQVQKGLSEYLETKRNAFPRFYFLSDDELLEILSQTKDPTAVQPHLRKCFENIARLRFEDDLQITRMYSGEGEEVEFRGKKLYPTGNVEDWMLEIENCMKDSLRIIIMESIVDYEKVPRTEWVLKWPGQVVLAGCGVYWAKHVTQALEKKALPEYFKEEILPQLNDLRELVNQKISKIGRMTLSALIVIEVHARDVIINMLDNNVENVNDFEWISQLRYYWHDENLYIRAVNAEFPYGYEYLGNTMRLVITPLTDRCYLTLTGALHLKFGGAPAGPAGTGKTETTKDLAKAMAIQCVVFNCSDQLDFMAMGKFFKGLASSGAWACFDEFNRIDIEVLSVVAMQIMTITRAQKAKVDRFVFEGVELPLKASCSVFITMNPGYAGRTELPDNLKALFRPVAMMVPDYALIAEISLFSFGFSEAKQLAKKIVSTFKLSSEQLSSQDHYDFGMRAVKSVISAAGNLKRQYFDMDEELIALRAIRDVNVPKFLVDDLKLFNGIVSDLFPNIKEQPIDYGTLDEYLRKSCPKLGIKDVEGFINKCIQLFETTVVRHGLMLVGPTGSGKTKCYETLKMAQTALAGQLSPAGFTFTPTHSYVLNPKSITMGQLYGEFDALTHEWTDGILSTLIRGGSSATNEDKRWYVFDGPVDAVWIENMNTVLDDNKKLCLSSGEIIKLTDHMTMMFEVADLAVASPATVSRCGMVYLEPSYIGLPPFVECWLRTIPENIYQYKEKLQELFDKFMEPAIDFVRHNVREIVGTVDCNLVFSFLKLLECFFTPFMPKEALMIKKSEANVSGKVGEKPIPAERLARIEELIEPWFIFALVWSIGMTGDHDSQLKFSKWIKEKMKAEGIKMLYPEEENVFAYNLDDAGISSSESDDALDDDEKGERKIQWIGWMEGREVFNIPPETKFSDIIVPTIDTVRSSHLLEMLLVNKKTVLSIGPTGTGKTLTIADKLSRYMPKEFIPDFIVFSAKTSANQTQDLIDGKLDKRRKGVFGPPLGKYFVFFIDDLNMPALETYGAQPPIELIRQYLDFKGWYDRKAIGEFRRLVDVNFVCAMGPPGGGRNPTTARLLRHFNFLAFTEMEDSSLMNIFGCILKSWISQNAGISGHCNKLTQMTIAVYNTISTQLLPTPAKSHYTFNLRDLSKVFQGILMAEPGKLDGVPSLLRLWYHESCRVFQDRLVNDEDRNWFDNLLREKMKSDFDAKIDEVINLEPILYADLLSANVENKIYCEVTDHLKLQKTCEDMLDDYNQINTAQMNLVLFMDALKHVCRISRVIRQPLGNALLLGMGGSGRQSLTRLAAHMADYECIQIELAKNYGTNEWREDLRKVMMKAGLENNPTVFLFSDTQIKSESFLEDLNNILNAGDVPNIYGFDEQDQIYTAMKPICLDAGLIPTKTNLFSMYTKRVRSNLHTVITMSPLGEIFRARLRQFPALVNCCTIDWFSEWPADALKSVALKFLQDIPELDTTDEVMDGLVTLCQVIHQSVATNSIKYLAEMSRHNYVTPTSYLELLGIFSKLVGMKKMELNTSKNRLKTGLEKLLTTAEEVDKLQEELATMKPLLEEAVKESIATMETISKDSVIAEETKSVVQTEEAAASIKATETQAIADDAQRDLNEALPALDAAVASLKSLNKNDVVEVRAMQRPPDGVKMVIEAVCIMKGVKPKRVAGDKPGSKIDDYWEPGKALLADPGRFLESLFKFDKDNIPDSVIKLIQPYIDDESFTPAAIAKVSKACTSICMWTGAMHKYHFVAKGVAPKRERLRIASEELAETQRVLAAAKARLAEVEEGIATLQAKYEDCVRKKDELEQKCAECEGRLVRADKLIGGLADEKERWKESVQKLESVINNFVGDVMVSSGYVAYLGTFTGKYRHSMQEEWVAAIDTNKVPRTDEPTLIATLSDPVKVRSWQIHGLPKDNLSVENGVIVQYSRRWPLFIDPQGQANRWVKNMEKDNGLDVIKLSDKDFLRSLENAVRFGKPCLLENIQTELDPALEPILLRQTFKQQGSTVIKLGDAVIPYHDDFKFYITTKLPNPHYTPEVSTKVSIVNFTLSPSGLEDQMLGIVVAEERPDLEEAKNQLIVSNAKMKQELKEIENKILYRLSTSEGSPVDDIDLINTLEASKIKSMEISAKVLVAEQTEKDIDITRMQYVPVAVNTQILFFCVADMANIDPMYQYSLEWFVNIFLGGISNAERADNLAQRVENINKYFTFSLYSNVCRSLFEKHKLLFAFLLCTRIKQYNNLIDMEEWRFFLAGGTIKPKNIENPSPDWISSRSWNDILTSGVLPKFANFADDFKNHLDGFKKIFDSPEPHREPLPGSWDTDLDPFQKMIVLKCLRMDKITEAMQDYVAASLGQRFIEPQTADLHLVFKDSSPTTPLIFVLSTGTDPAADLYKFAEEMRFGKKLSAISLGQGQGPRAEAMMRSAMERGKWVFFQNCHLAPSFMPSLERMIEQIDPDKVHRDFRLWLTSMPSAKFPVFILQNGSKMTVEPPRGLKANLLKNYSNFSDDFFNTTGEKKKDVETDSEEKEKFSVHEFKHLLLCIAFFHGCVLERRKFGALGFNIPYEFTDGDFRICVSQLKMFLTEYTHIPFKVLVYTAGHINYGGRVTDDWDRRCMMSILGDFYCKDSLDEEHKYSESGIYRQISTSMDHNGYMQYLRSLPINDTPEIFGLHENANITFAQNEAFTQLEALLKLQPKTASGGGKSREEIMEETAKRILGQVPKPFDLELVMKNYPVMYEQSMNTVLIQEVIRYNRLLSTVHKSLNDILKALKGLVVMSQELEDMSISLFNNMVPNMWAKKAYPSLKPLASWVLDLVSRVKFIQTWINDGLPTVYWISGFFFPQAFLTGTLQNFARQKVISIDTITFGFQVMREKVEELKEPPADGCYINGLFVEGARWDYIHHQLTESRPKELYTDLPILWLKPEANRKIPESGIYDCPCYKTLTRAGTLSTTGHSTNFVFSVELPTDKLQKHWIKRAVALLTALNY
ncbi:dynein axonemal heavy chain 1-like isoform X2 [Ruditapes philippinarum]|uniref:dynein axonemal heavy chain 1-like isoform X2 n=1 Tax=Ruditapes philippinarum TaxID=129788 RepID=UPI00295A7E22|nr:dynein axonemal heavy chain 1-like isoform X2 [Ruditapes philippinarum]